MKFYSCLTFVTMCQNIKDFNCMQGKWKVVSDSKSTFIHADVHIENNAVYINKVFTHPLPHERQILLQNVENYTQPVDNGIRSQLLVDNHRTLTDFVGIPVAVDDAMTQPIIYDFNATRYKDSTLNIYMKSIDCSEPRELKLRPLTHSAEKSQKTLSPTQLLVYLLIIHSVDKVVDTVVTGVLTVAQSVVSTCQ